MVKGANERLSAADIDAGGGAIAGADFLILQLEVPLETAYYALHFARTRGIRTILNPAPGQPIDLAQAAQADYLIPNETEVEALTATRVRTVEDASIAAGRLLDAGVPRVIVTLGANGALLAGAEGMRHIPTYPVQALDTTGAGDAFIGSFACFLAEGCGEADAVARANLYAALSTLSPGTQKSFVTRSQFDVEWARQVGVT